MLRLIIRTLRRDLQFEKYCDPWKKKLRGAFNGLQVLAEVLDAPSALGTNHSGRDNHVRHLFY
jgi:hypothetical protein